MEPSTKISILFSVLLIGFTVDYFKKPKIPRSQFLVNIFMGALAWPVGAFLLYKSLQHFSPQLLWRAELLPLWANTIIDFLLLDLFIYLWHRSNHTFPFLWKLHAVHHSDRHLNTLSAYRFHFLEVFLSTIAKFAYIACLDISLASLFLFDFFFAIQNLIQHSNIKYPKTIEKMMQFLFITPKLHFIHHHTDKNLQNKNYSTVFTFFDRLFGTFENNNHKQSLGIKDYNPKSLKELTLLPIFKKNLNL